MVGFQMVFSQFLPLCLSLILLFWHRINWGSSWRSRESSKTVPKAINAAIWRLLIFFVGTIVVISSLLPYHLAGLSANDVSSSPFVTVFNYIGIPYAEDIIRFVIITALLSAANSGLFAASRMMWSLSAKINYLKFLRNSRRLEHLLLPLL